MSHTDEQAKLWELIKHTRFGMLTHRHGDGQLHSHPLTTQNKKLDEGATLYFFIPKDGEIARHVASDPSVNVAYADTDADSYVSVSGQAALLDDPAKKEELFNTMAKSWFPKGAGDPNLGLLAVRIVDAEYWDVDDSKMVQLFKMAKAAITGKPPADLGEHRKLDVA
ncbi:pyridoxamine 5'-phosphate oxidase family protein [Variovorax saccharolyticus]|uniref:pyridoxamine 5'-phosphate oxidase family protein n=1 Tax=Variovorax saccharolyticus TaxID=3053516 RepID=UPI002577DF23|nr:pyridoxamine 5'-phosphate oxidase family protein [Variovorax sp. J22R187]MDM0018557.1 pyridoxamine 5'-phosphate oxidase family protein [Variovorax sp. J22R187]